MGKYYDQSRPRPMLSSQPTVPWKMLGQISTAISAPAVGARAVATVDALANVLTWDLPNEASNLMLRFETTADGDSHVLVVAAAAAAKAENQYGAEVAEYYGQGCSLALTGGKQVGGNGFFVDTATVTDGLLDMTELDTGGDRIAVVVGNARGFKHFAIYITTLQASTTVTVWGKWY
jgi:hypothetical protein